jgi:hypothetical protein
MVQRLLAAMALVLLTVAVAVVTGWPDLGRSLDLVTGSTIDSATESAFLALLCWLAVAVMVGLAVAGAWRAARARRTLSIAGRRSVAVLAVGVALLGVGLAREGNGYHVCCANPTTVQQAEHLVH